MTATISLSRSCDSVLIAALACSNWIFSRISILLSRTSTREGGFSTLGGGGGGGSGGGSPAILICPANGICPPQARARDAQLAATASVVTRRHPERNFCFCIKGSPTSSVLCERAPRRHARQRVVSLGHASRQHLTPDEAPVVSLRYGRND